MSAKSYLTSYEENEKTIFAMICNLIAILFKILFKNLFEKHKDVGPSRLPSPSNVGPSRLPSPSNGSVPASKKKRMKKRRMLVQPLKLVDARENLPSDVIMEFLRRLPAKSLIKLQLVCRDWKSMIHSSHFMEKYRDDSAIAMYYYHPDLKKSPSFQSTGLFTTRHIRYGLLLKQSCVDYSFCLCNPAIHRLLQLPNPQKHSYGFALSYNSANTTYSLVSFYKDGNSEACEVFVPGSDKEWRRLTSFPFYTHVIEDRRVKQKRILVVPSGEYVHCVRVYNYDTEICGEIVSMDVGTESFSVISLQKDRFRGWMKFDALDWNGKLGLWDIVEGNLEVMVMENCKKQKWGETKKIIQLPFVKSENYGNLIPLYAKDGDIWFQDLELNCEKIFTYTIDTGKVTTKSKLKCAALPKTVLTYNPSMVSFEGMEPDTKLQNKL